MSYNAIEISKHSSHIYELYKFTRNNTSWYYTSSDEDITYLGHTYISLPINRSNIEQSPESNRNPITVTLPMDVNIIREFIASPPTVVTTLTIYRGHVGDSDVLAIWVGRLVNIKFTEQQADLRIESVFSSLKRPCLRFRYQRNCPHDLYGQGCKVVKETFEVPTVVTVVDSTSFTSAEAALKPDGYYNGGYISWNNGGSETHRFILSHVGSLLVYDLPFASLTSGQTLSIFPGCDRTLNTCNSKFSNSDNFGGQPFYPEKNPFTGDMIF